MNFAFILFQSIGAYITAVLTFTRPSRLTMRATYWAGICRGRCRFWERCLAGGVLAAIVGAFALRPKRRDFQATVMLVVSIIASTLVVTQQGWFNGASGLYAIPRPFEAQLNLSPTGYDWMFVIMTLTLCALVYVFVDRITSAPWGRRLRAMRENPDAIESLGTRVMPRASRSSSPAARWQLSVVGYSWNSSAHGRLQRGAPARRSSSLWRSSLAAWATTSARCSGRFWCSACFWRFRSSSRCVCLHGAKPTCKSALIGVLILVSSGGAPTESSRNAVGSSHRADGGRPIRGPTARGAVHAGCPVDPRK